MSELRISEPSEPVQYAPTCRHDSPLAEAACAGCGTGDMLVRDHCHEHGWVRGVACRSCNGYLALIDRRFTPAVEEKHLAVLIAVRNSCPDCEPLDVSDLTAGSFRGPARTPGTVKQLSLRLPDKLYGLTKAAAKRNHRTLHGEILWRLEEAGRREREGLTPEVIQERRGERARGE